jgi:hypothetical protein
MFRKALDYTARAYATRTFLLTWIQQLLGNA